MALPWSLPHLVAPGPVPLAGVIHLGHAGMAHHGLPAADGLRVEEPELPGLVDVGHGAPERSWRQQEAHEAEVTVRDNAGKTGAAAGCRGPRVCVCVCVCVLLGLGGGGGGGGQGG